MSITSSCLPARRLTVFVCWISRINRSEASFHDLKCLYLMGFLMNDIYVHTLRYHYSGRSSRPSRTMYPISYGAVQG